MGSPIGPVEKYLKKEIAEGAIHFALIDPEKKDPKSSSKISIEAEKAGTKAILLGGSTIVSSDLVNSVAREIKKSVKIPLILFPGNISGVSRFADAIFFMSLLNSTNPYFLIGAQALVAPTIKKYGLETLPLGYITIGSGGSAGFIGYSRSIPPDKSELAAMHALAAQYLGMRFIYLEAGSGAEKPVPSKAIQAVRKAVNIPLIVGGGIKSKRDVKEAVKAGGDIVVTGTVVERAGQVGEKIRQFVKGLER